VVRGRDERAGRAVRSRRSKKRGPKAEPADHALGYSRGGFGTKLHLLTDGRGTPLAAVLTPGQTHESKALRPVMGAVRVPDGKGGNWRHPRALAGDKAYSCAWIRTYLRKRQIERVIPQKADQVGRRGGHRHFDKLKYRRRAVIEQCVGWLKELRRLGTRFEKLAVNFLVMVKLGFVHRYLRLLC
jgi:transposase